MVVSPIDAAICKIWFDGTYLRLLMHVGNLRRELRLIGFEEAVAQWLDQEMRQRFNGLGIKVKVSFPSLFFALRGDNKC